jgi:hypothetical protein
VDNRRNTRSTLKTAEHKGLIKGLAKGEAERAKLKANLDALQAEKQANMKDFVINSRKAGLQVDTIANITGLTIQQITEILKQHGLE